MKNKRRTISGSAIWRRHVSHHTKFSILQYSQCLPNCFQDQQSSFPELHVFPPQQPEFYTLFHQASLLFLFLVCRICSNCLEQSSSSRFGVILLDVLTQFDHLIENGSNKTISKENTNDDGKNDSIHSNSIELDLYISISLTIKIPPA